MRNLLIFFFAISLIACRQTGSSDISNTNDYDIFDEAFSEIETDSFIVTYGDWSTDTTDFFFGTPIANELVNAVIDTTITKNFGYAEEYYTIGKIKGKGNTTGYLLRTQLESVAYMQETYLFTFNSEKEFVAHSKIAGFVGAEGYINETVAMIIDGANIFVRNHEWSATPGEDDLVEKVNDAVFQIKWTDTSLEHQGLEYDAQDEWRKVLIAGN